MEFEFTDSLFVDDASFEEMCKLVTLGHDVDNAITTVASGWEDEEWYKVDYVREDLKKAILEEIAKKA